MKKDRERDLKLELGSATRLIRVALDRAEEKQREADAAWGMVQGARVRCGRAHRAIAKARFEKGVYGEKGKRVFRKPKV